MKAEDTKVVKEEDKVEETVAVDTVDENFLAGFDAFEDEDD